MVKFQKANLEHTKEGYIYPPGAYLGVAMVTDYLVKFIVSYIDHFDTPFIKMKKKIGETIIFSSYILLNLACPFRQLHGI